MLTVEDKVRTVVSNVLRIRMDSVAGDQRLVLDLGADSMDKLELLMQFDIELDDDALESAQTVDDLVRLVDAKRVAA